MSRRVALLLLTLLVSAPADTLILRDGTRVTGRWWAVDANEVHFLVDNQLRHYPRSQVSAVTFGADTPAPTPPTPPPAQPTKPPDVASPVTRPPSAPPSLNASRPGSVDIGPVYLAAVYFRSDSGAVTPLEKTRAVQHRPGRKPAKNEEPGEYWEMQGARSPVRFKTGQKLSFVVRMPDGADPKTFSLFVLETKPRTRRTKAGPTEGVPVTAPFTVKRIDESAYFLTPSEDLPPGEYSFSASSSNDGYCFGIDPGGA
jgi:hypothetical protein